jgi:hypothetical protein
MLTHSGTSLTSSLLLLKAMDEMRDDPTLTAWDRRIMVIAARAQTSSLIAKFESERASGLAGPHAKR